MGRPGAIKQQNNSSNNRTDNNNNAADKKIKMKIKKKNSPAAKIQAKTERLIHNQRKFIIKFKENVILIIARADGVILSVI